MSAGHTHPNGLPIPPEMVVGHLTKEHNHWPSAFTAPLEEVHASYHPENAGADIDALARAILDDEEVDFIDAYEAAIKTMGPANATALAHALELCPVHHCDYRICVDDQVDSCREARGDQQ